MKKKIFSIVLCLVLLVGLMAATPLSTSAAEPVIVEKPPQPWSVGQIIKVSIFGLPEFAHIKIFLGWELVYDGELVDGVVDFVVPPLPEDLQNVLMSCLRKDPEERPRSIEDLQSALRQCEADEWTLGDALRWWEVDFAAGGKKSDQPSNSKEDLTVKTK